MPPTELDASVLLVCPASKRMVRRLDTIASEAFPLIEDEKLADKQGRIFIDFLIFHAHDLIMVRNSEGFNEAPPTKNPSIFSHAMSVAQLAALTDPP
mgnify:CR=1 FL=1